MKDANVTSRTPRPKPAGLTIQQIIWEAKGDGTWLQLEARVPRDTTGKPVLSASALEKIAGTPTTSWPRKAGTIEAIAAVSARPPREVVEAYARAMGYEMDAQRTRLDIALQLAGVNGSDVSDDEARQVAAIVRAYLDARPARRKRDTAGDQTATD